MLIIAVDREGSKCRRVRLEGKSVRKLRHEIDRSIHYTQPRRTFNPFCQRYGMTQCSVYLTNNGFMLYMYLMIRIDGSE